MPQPASPTVLSQDAIAGQQPIINASAIGPNMGTPTVKRRSPLPVIIAIFVIVVLAVCGVVAYMMLMSTNNKPVDEPYVIESNEPKEEAEMSWYDQVMTTISRKDVREGQAPYKTDEEMQQELNRVVEAGRLNISIASLIEFDNSHSYALAYIENVPSNCYDFQVEISLDFDGTIVYTSPIIKPNEYIEDITLDTYLGAGIYPATATFTAFDRESHDAVGRSAASVTININN